VARRPVPVRPLAGALAVALEAAGVAAWLAVARVVLPGLGGVRARLTDPSGAAIRAAPAPGGVRVALAPGGALQRHGVLSAGPPC
jgi:hypothetical protein